MSQPFYVTTPLYYVNAAPHIGHSYTEVAADCLARYHRLKGEEVFLLTGTDEHGEKIAQAARGQGLSPREFVDRNSAAFRRLWELLGIAHDRFIRTTEEDHARIVQRALVALKPQLELGTYTFWYCTPCETSFGLNEIDSARPLCLNCQRPLTQTQEEDYYLKLDQHRVWLRQYILEHDTFILPTERRNEVLALLDNPLPDLCLTRPKDRVPWGIEVPFSPAHVTYVWFDALLNYISALGWPDDARFQRYWHEAGAVHLIGKDILRHHALYWPIILRALGLPPPRMIFAHGWWKIGEQKMSKSLGNIVDPRVVVTEFLKDQPHASDVYRYFLLREVPFGQDGHFSEDAILTRLGAGLGNDLGNLVFRTLSMIERYCDGRLPGLGPVGCAVEDEALRQASTGLAERIDPAMQRLSFAEALEAIFQVITQANRYIESTAPWQLAKSAPGRLPGVLHVLAEVIRVTAIVLEPFMPTVSAAIWEQIGQRAPRRLADVKAWPALPPGQSIRKGAVLFPRRDVKR
ncbi:MAG: methionine--tRNA ligase [Candidatus Omnitrophica bacterium]|nr:methionine--tRNA ligase [Candidatus Omnitrophota bacterium]